MGMYSLSLLESRLLHGENASGPAGKLELSIDSRKVIPGGVFVALPPHSAALVGNSGQSGPSGYSLQPGHSLQPEQPDMGGAAFIMDAVARGAAFVVCSPEQAVHCPADAVETVVCPDPRAALGQLARARYGTAKLPFPVVGVTGTNGKTTCTYLLAHLFESAGRRSGVLGTVAYRWPGHQQDAPMTTPDCLDLHAMLAAMASSGVDIAFMEVSSHALDQQRTAGLAFGGAVFTNLSQDHLDYHGDMEKYFRSKARLFSDCCTEGAVQVVGTDNDWGQKLLDLVPGAVAYGLKNHAAKQSAARTFLHGEVVENGRSGLHLRMSEGARTWDFKTPLVGDFNAENLLAVQALALGFGLSPKDFHCFETFNGVPGRLERIPNPAGLDIFVDYAHTPDALINVLTSLRGVGFTRIVTVFGCGGNRDRAKRPLMGEAVARLSDVAVLTSDNPRHEDPEAIMADVLPGLAGAGEVISEPDRRQAIVKALERLRPGDALLVAGKGHERTQQIASVKHPFSDQKVIREILGCV